MFSRDVHVYACLPIPISTRHRNTFPPPPPLFFLFNAQRVECRVTVLVVLRLIMKETRLYRMENR